MWKNVRKSEVKNGIRLEEDKFKGPLKADFPLAELPVRDVVAFYRLFFYFYFAWRAFGPTK